MRRFLFLLILLVSLSGCRHTAKAPVKPARNAYARLFDLQAQDGYTLLHIRQPYPGGKAVTYVLLPRQADIAGLPDSLQQYPVIRTPVRRIIATSVTHLEPFYLLGEGDKIIGFPQTDYIVSPYFRRRVDQGLITDIGNELMPDAETVLSLRPDIMLVFTTGNDRKDFSFYRQNGIPVLYMAEWMEAHPLGRAEWLKVAGALTGKLARADSIFRHIRTRYENIVRQARRIKSRPAVFKGGMFGDKWYVPGGASWPAKLIRDAGGRYVIDDSTATGSLTLNHENALLRLMQSRIWLDPGTWTARAQIRQAFPGATGDKLLQRLRIYSVNLKTDRHGRILFFEKSPMHPDLVLQDLFRIFRTDSLLPADSLHFYALLR